MWTAEQRAQHKVVKRKERQGYSIDISDKEQRLNVFEAMLYIALERLTKPLDIPPTDERASKRQECLMGVCSPLVPDAQSAEAV